MQTRPSDHAATRRRLDNQHQLDRRLETISLTQAMAQDWGADGIRVNAICPGLIKTKFSEALWQDQQIHDQFVNRIPLGRIGEPGDIAGLAVYLASDASAYCSGGFYMVDGGYSVN
jgi:NAD(P)-dependent dehydrogenase (short-subunit alcohol dehydrogenase family)